jgi:hypothetical protein
MSVITDDGEPRFVSADVCAVLEIGNVSDAVSSLDEDERSTIANAEGRNGGGRLLVITEAGSTPWSCGRAFELPKFGDLKRSKIGPGSTPWLARRGRAARCAGHRADALSRIEVIDSIGRSQTAHAVSEAGLYFLVMWSVFGSPNLGNQTVPNWAGMQCGLGGARNSDGRIFDPPLSASPRRRTARP